MPSQAPDADSFRRWSIGAVKITRVLEMPPLSADPAIFIQTNKQEILARRSWLCPDFADDDGSIKLHFQAFIIEAGGLRIMVDPCIGNDKPLDPDHVIVDEVRLQPTPGHTPGHCSVVVSSEGQQAVITGDVLHHPVQIAMPHVGDNFCWDQPMAKSARRQLLEQVSNRKALLLGSHFSGPTGIYLKRDGDAWAIDDQ